ncbi:MAG: DNA methyltransferase [Bacteroidota bacterium]
MIITADNIDFNFDKIPVSDYWNDHPKKESKMHKIHAYPAKFPAFIVTKSLGYAKKKNVDVNSIADVFCGCGTTALEAKQNEINFWGCDINPVATLIAKVKSSIYDPKKLSKRYITILEKFEESQVFVPNEILNHSRINYWFHQSQIDDLYKLLSVIQDLPSGKYRNFFLCAFSNILKPTSKWLTKSIKPQIDPQKPIRKVIDCFKDQFGFMLKGVEEIREDLSNQSHTKIETKNFLLKKSAGPFTDLLVTSPPYVTSYEYADLHQLSTLWLGYTNDYRELRAGTIGSLYNNSIKKNEIEAVNRVGKHIWKGLKRVQPAKARSAIKYFVDINKAVLKSYDIINPKGIAVFVIGNTKYSGVKVDNAKYLTSCMLQAGFKEIEVVKRKVSSKILTPYRDKNGKFSSDKRKRKVYGNEFIVIGRKFDDE